jgi:hypothetical protein
MQSSFSKLPCIEREQLFSTQQTEDRTKEFFLKRRRRRRKEQKEQKCKITTPMTILLHQKKPR